MPSKEEVKKAVLEAIRQTLKAKGVKPPATLDLSTPIDGSLGLDSLDWATVIVRLEEKTGVDPFEKPVERELKSIQDLIALYEGILNA
jgi:acyl carrier protein